MSIPGIADGISYNLRDLAVPSAKPSWRLETDRAALLVHDLQRYFMRQYAADCEAVQTMLANVKRLLETARNAGIPVFYTAQRGNQDQILRGLQRDFWGPGMQDIAEHTDILPEIAPKDGDTVLQKHRYSAFGRSDFGERLQASSRDQLIITGVYAHIGITATAFDAFQREIEPFIIADAVADFDFAKHQQAVMHTAACCAVTLNTDAALASLS